MRIAEWFVLAAVATGPVSAQADPIQYALDRAKAAYESEFREVQREVAAALDERRTAARQRGDSKELDRLSGVAGAWNRNQQLPHESPFRTITGKLNQARTALAAAYKTAAADYGKANQSARADAVMAELAALQESWDSVQVGSVWQGTWTRFRGSDPKAVYKAKLTVTERRGTHFQADVEFEPAAAGVRVAPKMTLLGDVRIDQVKAQNGGKYLKFTGSVTANKLFLTFEGFQPSAKKDITGSAELTLKRDPRRK